MRRALKSAQPLQKRVTGRWVGAVAAVLLGWVFYIAPSGFDQKLTRVSYDLLLLFKQSVTPDEVIIVFQDDESHDQLKQPHEAPWDRKLHARLLRRLKEDGSSAVIFDLVFDEPSTNAQDDVVFAAAIRDHGKVILGERYAASGEVGAAEISVASGLTVRRPIAMLATNAAATGMAEVYQSIDGIVREFYGGRSHGTGGESLSTFTWKAAEIAGAPVAKDHAQRDQRRWLNYYGPPEMIANVSYFRALDQVPPGFFRGKVVLIGVQPSIGYTGAGRDTFPSPFSRGNPRFAGVELHGTIAANLIRSDWLNTAPSMVEALLLAAFGLSFGRTLVRFRPLLATAVAVTSIILIAVVSCLAAWRLHFWFPWVTVIAIQIPVALGWSILFHWVQGQLERQFLEQSLSMYLSPKLVKKFSRDKDLRLLQPGATKQKLTIIFSDIASFTSISEGMDSDELAKMMNEYFEGAVGGCIHATDGTVVKYIGDAIFAFWNAPEPQADHAVRACDAALRFREMSAAEVRGKKLITRIGLHTGVANVGNFGSQTRVDYTAIGEDVNLASRMEGLNKYLGTTVLMTGAVKQEIGDQFITRYLGKFQLKGFERAVEVHELLGKRADGVESAALHKEFDTALRLFQQRDLVAAESAFQRIYEARPHDGSTQFYIKHIAEIRENALPENWSGEVELKEK
jgi:adenylate cyclase